MKVRSLAAVGVALVALVGAALPAPAPAADTASIYDTLAYTDELSVLFAAVTEAKEVTTLKSQGPFTLFAPTDGAFKTLDDATVKKLAGDKEAVRKLVRAHLVDGKLPTSKLGEEDGKELPTRAGGTLKVEKLKDGLSIGGTKVGKDIVCSNGVIHMIDVVLPTK